MFKRFLAFLTLFLFSACASENPEKPEIKPVLMTVSKIPPSPKLKIEPVIHDTGSVDMLYRASFTQGESTCKNRGVPPGTVLELNALLKANGKLFLTWENTLDIPGPSYFDDVVRNGNRVDWKKEEGWLEPRLLNRVTGIIDPDKISLDVAIQQYYWDAAIQKDVMCTDTYTIKGPARPLFDPAALDGHYTVFATSTLQCPGTNETSEGFRDMTLEVYDNPTMGKIGLLFDGWQQFIVAKPDVEKFTTGERDDARISGILSPAKVEMDIDVDLMKGSRPCKQLIHVRGAKRIPSYAKLNNQYRVAFSYVDECSSVGTDSESIIEVMRTSRGYLLNGFGQRAYLRMNGDTFTADLELEGSVTLVYEGTLVPGNITLNIVVDHPENPKGLCHERLTARGVPRFVFP